MTKADEYRARTLEAMKRHEKLAENIHPAVPLMPEFARELTQAFGEIFNLWPPAMDTRKAKKMRHQWAEWIRENTVTHDGKAIPWQDVIGYWRDISTNDHISIVAPRSTIGLVRAIHARVSRGEMP